MIKYIKYEEEESFCWLYEKSWISDYTNKNET